MGHIAFTKKSNISIALGTFEMLTKLNIFKILLGNFSSNCNKNLSRDLLIIQTLIEDLCIQIVCCYLCKRLQMHRYG